MKGFLAILGIIVLMVISCRRSINSSNTGGEIPVIENEMVIASVLGMVIN